MFKNFYIHIYTNRSNWKNSSNNKNLSIPMLKCKFHDFMIRCILSTWSLTHVDRKQNHQKYVLLRNILSSQSWWWRMNITDCGSCVKSGTEDGFCLRLGDLYTWLSLTLMEVICLIFYEPDVKLMAVFPLSLVGCGSTSKCTNGFAWNISACRMVFA